MVYVDDFNTISEREFLNNQFTPGLQISEPKLCPLCDSSGIPSLLSTSLIDNEDVFSNNFDDIFAISAFYCHSCKDVFLGKYTVDIKNVFAIDMNENYYPTTLLRSYPKNSHKRVFNPEIEKLSPKFVEIYNQSAAADSQDLSLISGIGYRKAVEFLIKDYAIFFNPDDKEKISSPKYFLKQCISEYMPDRRIYNLAAACAYIGNDESHFSRIHADRDVSDLKRLIEALLHYIEMEFTFLEATVITNK